MLFDKSVICPICIGGENDLQLLDRLITQSRNKSGQFAFISGEAGNGKSRFVTEDSPYSAHQARVSHMSYTVADAQV